jgi:hypothetical protein
MPMMSGECKFHAVKAYRAPPAWIEAVDTPAGFASSNQVSTSYEYETTERKQLKVTQNN